MKRSISFLMILMSICILYACWGRTNKVANSNSENNAITEVKDTTESQSVYANYLNNSNKYTLIALPFSLEGYLNFFYNNSLQEFEEKYPSYIPNSNFIAYLKSIDYEGEEYKCFIIPSKKTELIIILTWVLRGDTEYYLVFSADGTCIKSYLECGVMGIDDPIYFQIDENVEITRLQKTEHGLTEIDKYDILSTGKIVKI